MKYKIDKYLITKAPNENIPTKHKTYIKGRVYTIGNIKIGGYKKGKCGLMLTHVDSGLLIPIFDYANYTEFENDIDNFSKTLEGIKDKLEEAAKHFEKLPIYEY